MPTNWKCEHFDCPSLRTSFREIFLESAGIVITYQMTLLGDCFVVFCMTKVFLYGAVLWKIPPGRNIDREIFDL